MGTGAFGCLAIRSAQVGYPVDRTFFIRSVFTGDGWWLSSNYFVTGEPRHCHWMWWADIVAFPNGRLWMGWESVERFGYESMRTYSILVYCSDDGGKTWQSWRGVGFNGAVPPFGSGRKNRRYVKLVPYRGYVAVFAGEERSWFDGKKWSGWTGQLYSNGAIMCVSGQFGFRITSRNISISYVNQVGVLNVKEGTREWNDAHVTKSNDYETEMLRRFLCAIRTGDASNILTPYSDAVRTLQVAVSVVDALETGRTVDVSMI